MFRLFSLGARKPTRFGRFVGENAVVPLGTTRREVRWRRLSQLVACLVRLHLIRRCAQLTGHTIDSRRGKPTRETEAQNGKIRRL
jgi:hypothetical protein